MDTQIRPIEFPKKLSTADIIFFYADNDRFMKSMEPSRMMAILKRLSEKPISGNSPRKVLDGMINQLSQLSRR